MSQVSFFVGGGHSVQFLPARQHSKLCKRWYSQSRDVRLSVCPSVTLRYCIKTKKASVMISSPSESLNILVSRNSWLITKFDRGHPERGRFLRLGWLRTGDILAIVRHFRGPHSHLKPPRQRTNPNIRTNLISLETAIHGLHFCR